MTMIKVTFYWLLNYYIIRICGKSVSLKLKHQINRNKKVIQKALEKGTVKESLNFQKLSQVKNKRNRKHHILLMQNPLFGSK